MAKHRYPIGTRIRYKGCNLDDVGKEGKIVEWVTETVVRIVVPGSVVALSCHNDSTHPWTTYITDVEILARPNEQLLFDFMIKLREEVKT